MEKLDKDYMLNLMRGVRGVLHLMDDSPEKNRMLDETKKFISFLKGRSGDSIPENEFDSYRERIKKMNPVERIMSIFADYDDEKEDQELLAAGQNVARQLKDKFPSVEIPDRTSWRNRTEIHLFGYHADVHHVSNRQARQLAKEIGKRIHSLIEVPDGYEVKVTNICLCGQPDNDVHIYVTKKESE